MATETMNYGYPKPGEDDFYDITQYNQALDMIDQDMKEMLRSDGDTKDNVVTFHSGDMENPTGWAEIVPVESGEIHSSLWRKISLGIKNLRYLKKMLGSTDISKLGDGTITGALGALDTGLTKNTNDISTLKTDVQNITDLVPSGFVDLYMKFNNDVTIKKKADFVGTLEITNNSKQQKIAYLSVTGELDLSDTFGSIECDSEGGFLVASQVNRDKYPGGKIPIGGTLQLGGFLMINSTATITIKCLNTTRGIMLITNWRKLDVIVLGTKF